MSDSRRPLAAILQAHREEALGPFLRRLARASAAAGAVSLAACSGATHANDAGPADAGPRTYDTPTCSASGTWLAVHELATTRIPDYLDAVENEFFFAVVDSIGTACGGASDPLACTTGLSATESQFGRALRTTDGDVVERLAADVDVLDLLGSIDTPNEALLRVWLQGYTIACGDTSRWGVREEPGGYEVLATRMVADCDPVIVNGYRLRVASDGAVTIVEQWEIERMPGVCAGRRPEGLLPGEAARAHPVGGFFADVARLEASAVYAFATMAEELRHHGADDALVAAALAAARDEERHADVMGALATRWGATVPAAEVEGRPVRDLFAVALVGHHQALAAQDPEVRSAMRAIAEDETRHAALSWRLARWIEPRLSDDERGRIAEARARAIAELRAETSVEPAGDLVRVAGVPSARVAVAMLDQLADALWPGFVITAPDDRGDS